MKRAMASAAVVAVSVGILLGSAGTAAAQEPWGKYSTKSRCESTGAGLVASHRAMHYSCKKRTDAPASQRWWLYVV